MCHAQAQPQHILMHVAFTVVNISKPVSPGVNVFERMS